MAGYSTTPLAKKLGIKDGHRVALVKALTGFESKLDGLPESAKVVRSTRGSPFDVIVAFVKSRKELSERLADLQAALKWDGGLWVAWPKKASGVPTDVTEDVVREIALPKGLVDNKVCAIDDTWSGLRLVVRLENRPKKPKGRRKP